MSKIKGRLAPKDIKQGKGPSSFNGVEYNRKDSVFMDLGTTYGCGYTQPVGTKTQSNKSPIPQTTFCCDEGMKP